MIVVLTTLIAFLMNAVTQGMPMLYGATGEILTEKNGNLNLGIPGIMYMGAIGGLVGAYAYESSTSNPIGIVGILISFTMAFVFGAVGGAIYSLLTITLRANQNVTGLALTTFGTGIANFLGGTLGTGGQLSVNATGTAFRTQIPFLSKIPFIGNLFFSYGFMTYFGIALAIFLTWYLAKTRTGLNIRAVGESPATADAAGINVTRYKYVGTCVGAGIAGLGGLYYVMEYLGGVWQNNGLGDRGWLAVALVIFAIWKPTRAIWGSFLFGALYIIYLRISDLLAIVGIHYLPSFMDQELFKMLPYIVTVLVLVITSLRQKREEQPPASLGLSYFREER